jgi:hypothetical protein
MRCHYLTITPLAAAVVDYVALNAKLEAEREGAAGTASSVSKLTAGSWTVAPS